MILSDLEQDISHLHHFCLFYKMRMLNRTSFRVSGSRQTVISAQGADHWVRQGLSTQHPTVVIPTDDIVLKERKTGYISVGVPSQSST